MKRSLVVRATMAIMSTMAAATLLTACAGVPRPQAPTSQPPTGASMWVEPANIVERDAFTGPWGADAAPDPHGTYTLVEMKHTGVNLGMTVKDSRGRQWSVKQPYPGNLDSEAPVEVALSRLLSTVGYHQAPVYFLPAFNLKDDWGTHVETGGRFRLKQESLDDKGAWKWEDNPYVGTKPYQGLIVLLMMFNSTDLKNSNNTLYEHRGAAVEQWYSVRDIGAALGDTNSHAPRKNDINSFEKVPFILGVNDGKVEFGYNGWYKNLVLDRITVDDVKWASDLLGGLTDRQWNDAFRAAGYEPAVANRFIAKLKEKIEQGRTLGSQAAR